jgi:hypothetical protein
MQKNYVTVLAEVLVSLGFFASVGAAATYAGRLGEREINELLPIIQDYQQNNPPLIRVAVNPVANDPTGTPQPKQES